jgi:hypothetical protein
LGKPSNPPEKQPQTKEDPNKKAKELFFVEKKKKSPRESTVWIDHRKIKKDALYKPMLRGFRKHLRRKFYKLVTPEVKLEPKHKVCKAIWKFMMA